MFLYPPLAMVTSLALLVNQFIGVILFLFTLPYSKFGLGIKFVFSKTNCFPLGAANFFWIIVVNFFSNSKISLIEDFLGNAFTPKEIALLISI